MKKKLEFPPIGMRIIKSSLAVFICLVLDTLRSHNGMPFYSAIAAVLCIQPYQEEGWKVGWSRICGTLIGALWGTAALLLNLHFVPEQYFILRYAVMSLAVIPVIYTAVVLKKNSSVFISCIVLLSINVNHINDTNPYLFVMNRVMDTSLGVGIALLMNALELPKRKNKEILFVAELEETMLTDTMKLSPYDEVMLNRMIDSGALFTISSYGSPPTVIALTAGIHLKLPVILLDGAALYDMESHAYIREYVISYQTTELIMKFMKQQEVHCFATSIVENTLITYIGEFRNELEAQIYQRLNRSPYWNYLHKEVPEGRPVVYFMVVDTVERITQLRSDLEQQDFYPLIRLNCYESKEDPNYMHMKLYNRNALAKNMVDYLQQEMKVARVVSFGNMGKQAGRIYQNESAADASMVREMQRIYQPYIWTRERS